ncbi:mCG1036771, partial [Mus musculus]
ASGSALGLSRKDSMLVFVTSLFRKLDAKLLEGLGSPGSSACPPAVETS